MTAQPGEITLEQTGIQTELIEMGHGKPILFLHSGDAPTAFSDTFLRILAETNKVLAPTHPGFGQTSRPRHFRRPDDLAYFYLDLIEQRGLSGLTLVGASFGGWIALEMAIRSCQAIERLVLIDPLGLKLGDREDREIADLFALGTEERLLLEFHDPTWARRNYQALPDAALESIARARESLAAYGWRPFMHNPQLRHWLHRITVSTLVIRGAEDRVVVEANHKACADLISRAHLVTVPGAGHHPHIEQPESVVRAMRDFASIA